MSKKPPSQGTCLWLARMYWEATPRTKAHEQLSWNYLVMWAFYDMYLEDWALCHSQTLS